MFLASLLDFERIELNLFLRKGAFDKAFQISKTIEEKLTKFDDKIIPIRRAFLAFIMAVIHIGMNDFNRALFWINSILNDSKLTEVSAGYLRENLGYIQSQYDFDISVDGAASSNISRTPGDKILEGTDFISRMYFTGMTGIKDNMFFPPEAYQMEYLMESYLEYHLFLGCYLAYTHVKKKQ